MSVETLESGPYTLTYLDTAPDDGRRREIIDGGLFVTPSPSRIHQRAVVQLGTKLNIACPAGFEVLVVVFDVFEADNLRSGRRDEYRSSKKKPLEHNRIIGAATAAYKVKERIIPIK